MLRIDFHSHQFPAEWGKKMDEYYPNAPRLPLRPWDRQLRLDEMDQAKVDIEILSNPGMYGIVDEHSPELCRIVNDAIAETRRSEPERFRAFAHIPFNSMDAAVSELARAIDELGCIGVMVTSNVGGRYLHTPDFLPFWDEVSRRRVPVFLHPTQPAGYQDDEMPVLVHYEFDTTLSATKLIYSGIYERFPELILILGHLGGAMPFLSRRIDVGYDVPSFGEKYKQIPRRPSEYTRKLWFETGLCYYKPAFECAVELVGFDQIVYGTDHFSVDVPFMKWTNQFLESLDLSPVDQEKIYCRNAERILKL